MISVITSETLSFGFYLSLAQLSRKHVNVATWHFCNLKWENDNFAWSGLVWKRQTFVRYFDLIQRLTSILTRPDISQTLFLSVHKFDDAFVEQKSRRKTKGNLRRKLSGKLIDCSLGTKTRKNNRQQKKGNDERKGKIFLVALYFNKNCKGV